MSTPIKLAVIGAGSAQFSLGLVKDICLTESLNGSLITFMDIDADRLDMIHKLGVRYADELGADLRFESTTDQQEALQDVDFVINTASASSHQKQRNTRELMAQNGYYYGGRMRQSSYANLNLMRNLTRAMEEICPQAWLIQSGNPVYEGCTMMTRETSIKVCGLCHGHYGVYQIASTIGLTDWKDITWQAPGLNHNIWLTHFYYKGEDAYPILEKWIAQEGEYYWRTHVAERTHDIQMSRGTIHMYRMFDLMPIGDTPRRGGWWYHTDLDTKKWWYPQPWGGPDTELARPLFVENLEKHIAQMTELAHGPSSSLIEVFGAEKTKEQQVPIIDGLVNDNEGQFQVNVPNRGALAAVPDDVVVEVPAIVNKKGIQPIRVDPLPAKILYTQIMPEVLAMERDLLAFHSGDRSLLLWNTLDCPQTHSYNQALAVFEDIMAMDDNEEANAHYMWGPAQEILLEPVREM